MPALKTLNVDLGERSYPIFIGEKLLDNPSLVADFIRGGEALVVTNETVAPLYLDRVRAASDVRLDTLVLPDGERYKSVETVQRIYQTLLENRHSRQTTLIALGGGVVGDMTGFAAATYQRGVNFIQIPTTLLAQVDSSVGGKTGVNHPLGKNMIGAFHQPVAVVADVATLATLPDREYRAGLAEVIKYGLIVDEDFFRWLETNLGPLLARDAKVLATAVERSCRCKARVVAEDEREAGIRAILNLGHTFGHAIETAQHYQGLLHGEAVAVGMAMAADLSRRLGWLSETEADSAFDLLRAAGLPVTVPREMTPGDFMALMAVDKKAVGGEIRLVLLDAIGAARVSADYSRDALAATLAAFCQR